jgi:hypothetical protein
MHLKNLHHTCLVPYFYYYYHYLAILGFELRDFYCGYFWNSILLFLPMTGWTMIFLSCTSCHSWEDNIVSPHSAIGWDEVSQTFFWLRLVLNCSPPDLSLPSSYHYRHEIQCSTLMALWNKVLLFFFFAWADLELQSSISASPHWLEL